MNQRDVMRFLNSNGFTLVRDQGPHMIWSDGFTQIATSRGGVGGHRGELNLKADVRRAVRKREERNPPPADIPAKGDPMQNKTPFNPVLKSPIIIAPKANGHAPEPPVKPFKITDEIDEEPGYSKFDPATRHKVWKRIYEMSLDNVGKIAIAAQLDKEGFKMPDGRSINASYVGLVENYCKQGMPGTGYLVKSEVDFDRGVKANSVKHVQPALDFTKTYSENAERALAPPPKPSKRLPEMVMAILTDPEMNDSQKIRMIMTYVENS